MKILHKGTKKVKKSVKFLRGIEGKHSIHQIKLLPTTKIVAVNCLINELRKKTKNSEKLTV